MNEQNFLKTIKKKGGYASEGEASLAANSVFGTIKSWLAPSASEAMRKVLPGDASQLWAFAPVGFKSGVHNEGGAATTGPLHFILRVQQVGRYESSSDARRAVNSVLGALVWTLPGETGRFLGRMIPPEIIEACRADEGWAA